MLGHPVLLVGFRSRFLLFMPKLRIGYAGNMLSLFFSLPPSLRRIIVHTCFHSSILRLDRGLKQVISNDDDDEWALGIYLSIISLHDHGSCGSDWGAIIN